MLQEGQTSSQHTVYKLHLQQQQSSDSSATEAQQPTASMVATYELF